MTPKQRTRAWIVLAMLAAGCSRPAAQPQGPKPALVVEDSDSIARSPSIPFYMRNMRHIYAEGVIESTYSTVLRTRTITHGRLAWRLRDIHWTRLYIWAQGDTVLVDTLEENTTESARIPWPVRPKGRTR
jgi:hypothetical protein